MGEVRSALRGGRWRPARRPGPSLADEAGDDDWDEEHFREMTARCLEAGEFRLVLAVEAIPDELREIVRFLNVHSASQLEVLALELSYRRDGEVEILVPHAWGEETVKPSPDGGRAPLDREKLLAGIGEETPAADAAAAVLDWADRECKRPSARARAHTRATWNLIILPCRAGLRNRRR